MGYRPQRGAERRKGRRETLGLEDFLLLTPANPPTRFTKFKVSTAAAAALSEPILLYRPTLAPPLALPLRSTAWQELAKCGSSAPFEPKLDQARAASQSVEILTRRTGPTLPWSSTAQLALLPARRVPADLASSLFALRSSLSALHQNVARLLPSSIKLCLQRFRSHLRFPLPWRPLA